MKLLLVLFITIVLVSQTDALSFKKTLKSIGKGIQRGIINPIKRSIETDGWLITLLLSKQNDYCTGSTCFTTHRTRHSKHKN